jgi:hypothetical protein
MISSRARLSRGRMIWLLAHTLSLQKARPATHIGRVRKRDNLPTGEGGGRGAESSDRKKALSSINHSIFTGGSGADRFGRRIESLQQIVQLVLL